MSKQLAALAAFSGALVFAAQAQAHARTNDPVRSSQLHAPHQRVARGPDGRSHLSPDARKELEAKVQKRMDTFVTVELASELDLDQAGALKLLEAWKKHREAISTSQQAIHGHAQALADALKANASDAVITSHITALNRAVAAREDATALLSRTKSFLTVPQQGKLLLAYPQIQRSVRKMLRRARHRGGPPPIPEDTEGPF